jgi:hypothetical protein
MALDLCPVVHINEFHALVRENANSSWSFAFDRGSFASWKVKNFDIGPSLC